MALTLEVVHLIAVMCESLLVGVYAVLVLVLCYILSTGDRMPTIRKVLFGTSITMFVISVAHLGLVMQEVTLPRAPEANRKIQIVLSTFQFVLGDLILIWRVWVIWMRNYWITGGPLAIMIAAAGLSLNLTTYSGGPIFFLVAPSALIVANTFICTSLIAGRIWYMSHQTRKHLVDVDVLHSPRYTKAMSLIIESGALYTLSLIICLILDRVGSNALPIMLDLEIPLIGILPTLIVVLVHFNMVPGTRTKDCYAVTITNNCSLRWQIPMNTTTNVFSQAMVTGNCNSAEYEDSTIAPTFDKHKPGLEPGEHKEDGTQPSASCNLCV